MECYTDGNGDWHNGTLEDIAYERHKQACEEEEQKTLESRVSELKKLISDEKESSVNVDRFLALVRKYTDVRELNAEIIREFVEKIYVYQTERINGKKVQRIRRD